MSSNQQSSLLDTLKEIALRASRNDKDESSDSSQVQRGEQGPSHDQMHRKTFADVIHDSDNNVIVRAIIENLKKIPIHRETAEITLRDPELAACEVAYYRNLKHKIFSVFDKLPAELDNLQTLNLLLIHMIPGSSFVPIDYNLYKEKVKDVNHPSDMEITRAQANVKSHETPMIGEKPITMPSMPKEFGNVETLTRVYGELILLLRLREEIDYENTIFTGSSNLLKWLLKRLTQFKKTKDTLHVVLTPEDHKVLTKELNMQSNKIAYKMFVQTISLLAYHYNCLIGGRIKDQLNRLLNGEVKTFQVHKNMGDIKEVEPFYIWQSVLSPVERGYLIGAVGVNFFHLYNRLSDYYRRGKREVPPDWKEPGPSKVGATALPVTIDAARELKALNNLVRSKLPQSILAVVYGRLGRYNEFRRKHPEHFTKNSRTGTLGQITFEKFLKCMSDEVAIDIFAEENIIAVLLGIVSRSTEITQLTKLVRLNRDTATLYYYEEDIKSVHLISRLLSKESDTMTAQEKAFLDSIYDHTRLSDRSKIR